MRKMHTRDERIRADREDVSRGHGEQRRIIADTQAHILARDRAALADQCDQAEFVHAHFAGLRSAAKAVESTGTRAGVPIAHGPRPAVLSSADRHARAALSSTPLT